MTNNTRRKPKAHFSTKGNEVTTLETIDHDFTVQDKLSLVEADYIKMQAIIDMLITDATGRGADKLTLAHALFSEGIDRLLQFHPPGAVETLCKRQVKIIDDLRHAEAAKHAH